MTTSMVPFALASLFFVAPPGPLAKPIPSATKQAAAKKSKKKKKTQQKSKTKKPSKKQTAHRTNKDLGKVRPKFKPLLPKKTLVKQAEQKNVVPVGGDTPLTTLATLSAANSRQGNYAIDFRCAFVMTYSQWGDNGYAQWPQRLVEFCRASANHYDPGVEINFTGEAGKAYAIDCNSDASQTRWRIKHRIAGGDWSTEEIKTTATPMDVVLADRSGRISVRFEFDPVDNHILTHRISKCRVSRIGG